VKKGTKIDISSTWIYRRSLNTSTSYSTRALHNMMLICILTIGPDLMKYELFVQLSRLRYALKAQACNYLPLEHI
jgi:hypothetical protein